MIEIAEMSITDYDAVRAFLQETPGLTLRSADSRTATERYLARNPGLSFVARSGDRIVGCVMCGHDGRRGYLQHLVVDPHLRRHGLLLLYARLTSDGPWWYDCWVNAWLVRRDFRNGHKRGLFAR